MQSVSFIFIVRAKRVALSPYKVPFKIFLISNVIFFSGLLFAQEELEFESGFLRKGKNGASPSIFQYKNAILPGRKKVDILINNAGVQHVAPVDEFPIEKWDQLIAILLSAPFHAMRAALPFMKDKGWGRIISTASAHSMVASPNKSAYNAAKHGLMVLVAGTNVLRIVPSLVIPEADLKEGLARLDATIAELVTKAETAKQAQPA